MAARTKVFVDIVTRSDGKAPGAGLKKFAIGAGIATAALVILVKVGKEWSKAASDAEEVGSKYATIFRDITKQSEGLADSFAKDFGLAGSSARELLGNTADLLTGFGLTQQAALDMSLATNELAADLASFSNAQGGAEAVSKALTAAYSGERESLKTYGIIINEAMVKAELLKQAQEGLTFASERQAKISATLALAIEQSGNAIGDVARTFNSHANVTRRLEESTKSFKEEMGKMVNEGATPMLIITDKLVKSMAEWLEKLNESRNILKDLTDGSVDAKVSLETLQSTLETLQNITVTGGIQGVDIYKTQIAALEELIANYDHVHERIEKNKKALQIHAAISQLALDIENDRSTLSIQAFEELEELRVASLSSTEKELALLQDKINFWAVLRGTVVGAEEIFQELARQRNELVNTNRTDIVAAGEDWLSLEQEKVEHLIWIDNLETEINLRRIQEADEELRAYEKMISEKIALAQQFGSMSISLITAIASIGSAKDQAELQRMEDAGAGEEELETKRKQIAHDEAIRTRNLAILSTTVNTASAIIGMLADPGGFAGVALSIFAGATGLAQIAAATAAPIPSLATGGQFITDGPTLIGDNASGQERITVEPLGGGGGNNTGQIMILRVGDRDLKAVVQGWIDNRGLHSSFGGAI